MPLFPSGSLAMAGFEFATAGRIVFGPGSAAHTPAIALAFSRRVLVVTGATPERAAWLVEALEQQGAVCTLLPVSSEPDVAFVQDGAALVQRDRCGAIVSVGGGSAIDAGKAIAVLATNEGDPFDYLEVIGRGRPLSLPSLPFIAIPTTAGTGSEVTRNAVLAVPERRMKVSLRSPLMLPRVAIVDAELSYGLSAATTARTGLDALTQLVEPFLSMRANPLTDAVCRDGIPRIARSLRRACEDGHDARARGDMALASLCGGLALANAGLGAVHGLAAPIGGLFAAPHGAVCAALLPHVFHANLHALRERDVAGNALCRADEIGRMLTGQASTGADAATVWLRETCAGLAIPPLSFYGVGPADLGAIVERAQDASSMKSNPIVLTAAELHAILVAAL